MPLWDSIQRSLEKASQEAARMAKTQRLRSTIDGLSRQISTQSNNIVNKTMDLFSAGELTQSELLPLCQEITNLQQQLNHAQNELKQIQATQPQTSGPQTLPGGQAAYPPTGESLPPNVYAPPEYQSYLDSTQGGTVPPPPPGVESLTVSSTETIQIKAKECKMRQHIITVLCYLLRLPFALLNITQRPFNQRARQHPQSIVVIKPCCLGDLLMTTPLLEVIRHAYPEASITYLAGTW